MTATLEQQETGLWGRAWETTWVSSIGVLLLLTLSPLLVFYFYIACHSYGGSLIQPVVELFSGHLSWAQLWHLLPSFSWDAIWICAAWLSLQIVLAVWVPDCLHRLLPKYRGGVHHGSITPAGYQLPYVINGLQSWLISHVLFFMGVWYFFSPTIIFDNWGPLLLVANIVGNVVALIAYIKAKARPCHPEDRKTSGNLLYDYFMGVEFNPRIGRFDFKLFFNGRPGIVAWTLINISFAAKQLQLYGHITNSMIVVNALHFLYVIYFFWNEAWYLRTIDICHDHFGWMLAWGDCVWLPYMYTLQGLYLVFNPVQLSTWHLVTVWTLGLVGFWIFCAANNQKERFRQTDGKALVWGKPPKYIECSYTAADGKERASKLLCSGWWGVARHFNYTGDLMGCLAYCMACGFNHILPYFYVVYMTILLVHRCIRDEHRLQNKYGAAWQQYCQRVPYRLIPRVF